MSLQNLEKQVWYWGKEDKEDANRALAHCLDGFFLVRQSSNPPDQTIHVVDKGVVKLVRILVRGDTVGLSPDYMTYKSVVDVIENFSKVSLAQHNKNLNVRLTNPLPKDPDGEEVFEEMSKEEETWAVYVNFYLTSEIRMKEEEKCLVELTQAQEEANRLSYCITAQHMVVEMFKEQIELRSMTLKYFSSEYGDFLKNNFEQQKKKLEKAEEELETICHQVTRIQAKVRELAIARDDMDRKKRMLFRKMDWIERCLSIEGFNNDTITSGIAPFTQNLGTRILIEGIKEMWFVGEMNSNEAEKVLSGHLNGTFMVRLNNERKYVLSVINKSKVRHIVIHENEEKHRCWLKSVKQFTSVEALVAFFRDCSLGQQDKEFTTPLKYPIYSCN